MNQKTLLKISDLSKTFHQGTPNENRVIKNLSLSVQKGDFITVIGGNGAGKSTLLNLISGSLSADKGKIFLGGKEITKLQEEKRAVEIARVFQDPLLGTAPRMTVEENMALAMRRGERRLFKRNKSKQTRELFESLLKQVDAGLETRLEDEVGQLSGGQRQMIAILMATIKRPSLLLLDEHTAALDPKAAETVIQLTNKKIKEEKLTALMITHNMKQALQYGNRLIMMKAGKIAVDISGKEKEHLTIEKLMTLFQNHSSGEEMMSDRFILS